MDYIKEIILAIVGLVYVTYIANKAIYPTVKLMWSILQLEVKREKNEEEVKPRPWQGKVVGVVERILFLLSLLTGNGQFIGLWLGIKTVSQYKRWSDSEIGRATFNIFIAGNALSLLYMATTYGFIDIGRKIEFPQEILPLPSEAIILALILLAPIILSIIIYKDLEKYKKSIEPTHEINEIKNKRTKKKN
jgi:hypothetical protein